MGRHQGLAEMASTRMLTTATLAVWPSKSTLEGSAQQILSHVPSNAMRHALSVLPGTSYQEGVQGTTTGRVTPSMWDPP